MKAYTLNIECNRSLKCCMKDEQAHACGPFDPDPY